MVHFGEVVFFLV